MFLNGNQDHSPIEGPAPSPEQALRAVYLAGFLILRQRWPPFLRARRGLRAEKAFTPAAASPQGKARTRSLGNECGHRQIFLVFNMYLLVHLLSSYFLRDADGVYFLPLVNINVLRSINTGNIMWKYIFLH